MPNITLKNVSYRYKSSNKNAISNISLTFEEGKMTAVVGPSGSGKTTLLSIISGLDCPSEGIVTLGDKNLADMNLDVYRREDVAIIFQAFQLFPLLTVLENVCYPQEINGVKLSEAKVKASQYLESVGIDAEKHKRYPAKLSGGEQQRVAIARALATGAHVILADEPTGNLDTENGKRVIDILKKLAHEKNYCVIIVTHDMDIAAASDVVYKMVDGSVMEGV
ncbi:MAG: ABC transporter ATP-binding protein [Oscillospiraceae bacterium]|nr:ABC transporter ATP-binding protein [Oscillospiraceae bacterium]